jgi:hypothetical protein
VQLEQCRDDCRGEKDKNNDMTVEKVTSCNNGGDGKEVEGGE